MGSNFRLFTLASTVIAFAALPVAAQNQASHGSSGGTRSSVITHSASGGSGMKMIGTSNSGHGGGDGHHNDGGHNGHNHDNHRNNNYGNGYGYGGYGYGWGTSTELPYDTEYGQLEGRGTFDHGQPQEQPDNRVGPTIFEHNGQASGAIAENQSAPPMYRPEQNYDERPSASDSGSPVVLVFRDGHQQEVSNYAIAGTHLIVLGSKTQKILLTDLDLNATSKANADRGVDFKMPQS